MRQRIDIRTALVTAFAAAAVALAPAAAAQSPAARVQGANDARTVDARGFLNDLNRFAPSVIRLEAHLDQTDGRPAAVQRTAARLRRDLVPVDAILDRMAGYRVTDTELEHRRQDILRAGRPAVATGMRMLAAAAAGNDAVVRAAARRLNRQIDALNDQAVGD